jgi:aldose 1-epimerase
VTGPPSGEQFEIRSGAQRAVIVEVGGGIREYTVGEQPVLDGFAISAMADGGRGQPLLPWPNRIRDGQYTFDAQSLQLPIEEASRHNAMHGLTRWANWSVIARDASSVRVAMTQHPRSGYPFSLSLEIEYTLDADGLSVRTLARNIGDHTLPFGAGQHPYLSVGTTRVDAATLRVPAAVRLELDRTRMLPTGQTLAVAGTDFDFREPRAIGALQLDDCFTDLLPETDGRVRVELVDPKTNTTTTLWLESPYRYVQVFTGDTLAAPRRRQGLAVEPMTCPPDAFRSGRDLIVLQPNEAVSLAWGISPGGSTRT